MANSLIVLCVRPGVKLMALMNLDCLREATATFLIYFQYLDCLHTLWVVTIMLWLPDTQQSYSKSRQNPTLSNLSANLQVLRWPQTNLDSNSEHGSCPEP